MRGCPHAQAGDPQASRGREAPNLLRPEKVGVGTIATFSQGRPCVRLRPDADPSGRFCPGFLSFPAIGARPERVDGDQAAEVFVVGGGRHGPRAVGRVSGTSSLSLMSAAIFVALWASTPQPHHVRAPSMPSIRARFQPQEGLRCEMRPSDPVRHLTSSQSVWNTGACGARRGPS
jgi:hypothetical protein